MEGTKKEGVEFGACYEHFTKKGNGCRTRCEEAVVEKSIDRRVGG